MTALTCCTETNKAHCYYIAGIWRTWSCWRPLYTCWLSPPTTSGSCSCW